VIVADVALVTDVVAIEKVALLALAGTVTFDATVAEALLLDRLTTIPPLGAGPVKVTVPVEGVPPTTLVGFRLTVESPGGLMARLATLVTPLALAESVAVTVLAVGVVVTVKRAIVDPACTVTDEGTCAFALSEEVVTTVPPVGAALFNVKVACAELPPTTLVGLTTREDGAGGVGFTVSCTVC